MPRLPAPTRCCALVALCGAALFASSSALAAEALTVRADRPLGPMPYLFRNGNAVNVKPLGYPLQKFFSDQKPGSFYVASWNLDHYLACGGSVQRLRAHRDDDTTGWNNNLAWMKAISDHGGEVIIVLGTSYWYGPKDTGFPPKDLDQWERFVRDTVDLFDVQLKLNVRYQVWDEPDTEFFRGSLEEYYEVVRRAAIGLKKANPRARLGGPGVSHFDGRGFKASKTEKRMVENFIRYCARTPLPEVGLPRIPIDFVGWHVFDEEPYTTLLKDQAAQVRSWLKECGYDEQTELNIDSWSRLSHLTEEEYNGPFTASYILPMLCAMDEAGIRRHVYFNVFDHWIPEAQGTKGEFFEGGYGLFSKHYVTKALYNSFQAMGMVEGRRLAVEEADPFLTAIAAEQDGRIAVLVSNYMPKNVLPYLRDNTPSLKPVKDYLAQVRELRRSTGQPLEECADEVLGTVADPDARKRIQIAVQARERMQAGPPEDLAAAFRQLRGEVKDPAIRRDLDEVAARFQEVQRRRAEPVQVALHVAGLSDATGYRFEHYVIDATHSNAYAVKDRIERIAAKLRDARDAAAVPRAVAEINAWPQVTLTCAERRTLRAGEAPARTLEMLPYSVHLLVFSKR